jgi:transposase
VRELRRSGKSLRAVAKELDISHTSVVRLARQEKTND